MARPETNHVAMRSRAAGEGGAVRLRPFDQAREFREPRAGADAGDPHPRRVLAAGGAGVHRIAGVARDRRRFAGEQRFLEAGAASSSTPSAGTGSPTATRTTSPMDSASTGTDSRLPSASSRVANAGRARASASTCALAMPRARCSSWRATSSRNTNITAASYQTWVPPRTVSQVLAAHASSSSPRSACPCPARRPRSSFQAPTMNGQPAQNTTGVDDQERDPAEEVARGHRHLRRGCRGTAPRRTSSPASRRCRPGRCAAGRGCVRRGARASRASPVAR